MADEYEPSESMKALTEKCDKYYGPSAVRYDRLTKHILDSIPDDELDSAIASHVDQLIGEDHDHEYDIVSGLPIGLQMVHATYGLEGEVMNGGFIQYFWNSSGQFAAEALEGYRLIGATEHAMLVDKAICVFMRRIRWLAPLRWVGTVEAFFRASQREKSLHELSERFWQILHDAGDLRVKYIRAHPEQFVD